MSDVLLYDIATGYGKSAVYSVNTPDYEGKAGVIVNPDKTLMKNVKPTYIKVVAGVPREMTAQEKAAVDAAVPPKPVPVEETVALHTTELADHETRIAAIEIKVKP